MTCAVRVAGPADVAGAVEVIWAVGAAWPPDMVDVVVVAWAVGVAGLGWPVAMGWVPGDVGDAGAGGAGDDVGVTDAGGAPDGLARTTAATASAALPATTATSQPSPGRTIVIVDAPRMAAAASAARTSGREAPDGPGQRRSMSDGGRGARSGAAIG
ncbi:hypothetical protein ACN263_29430 [Micromonospora sp. WMMD729]|uniref:hypothetical protein n=1 Tax=Micromonospora sp. WMMD729 TaxID=3404127 RepID=UPI003BF5DF3D